MRIRTLTGVFSLVAAGAISLLGGCSSGYRDREYRVDRATRYDDRSYEDRSRAAGDRNTRIADKLDDGRVNGSARSFDERKASRAADEGDINAARREGELRRDRELGR